MRRAFEWLWPASLAGRITLTMLAGLLAIHLGSLWLLERGVLDATEDGREAQVAERLASAPLLRGVTVAGVASFLAAVGDEHPERPARLDRAQLRPIADEHDLGSDLGGVLGDGAQAGGLDALVGEQVGGDVQQLGTLHRGIGGGAPGGAGSAGLSVHGADN